jgi:hypothetical protein
VSGAQSAGRGAHGADSPGLTLGRVSEVHATRLVVELDDPGLAAEVTVLDLVAVAAGGAGLLLGLVEAVRRPASGAVELTLIPIGMLTAPAAAGGLFARAVGKFPHVGARCWRLDGERLGAVMRQLSGVVEPRRRLVLGRHVGAGEAEAIADGDRLFARHVAVVGSSGTGKSWLIALLAERAATLGHANMVILDLHGEYGPLGEGGRGGGPVARVLRIAGAGDVVGASEDLLYLPYWMLHRDELLSLLLDEEDPYASDHAFRSRSVRKSRQRAWQARAAAAPRSPAASARTPRCGAGRRPVPRHGRAGRQGARARCLRARWRRRRRQTGW